MHMKTKRKTTSSKPFTVRLDEELREALEREATLEDRSAAQLAMRAIKSMLQAKAAKRNAIAAAVGEAEQGMFVSQAAVADWMESWDGDDELPAPTVDNPASRSWR